MSLSDQLKFDANGLIPAIARDAESGEVLMMAYMNAEAVERTVATGRVRRLKRRAESSSVPYTNSAESPGQFTELLASRIYPASLQDAATPSATSSSLPAIDGQRPSFPPCALPALPTCGFSPQSRCVGFLMPDHLKFLHIVR